MYKHTLRIPGTRYFTTPKKMAVHILNAYVSSYEIKHADEYAAGRWSFSGLLNETWACYLNHGASNEASCEVIAWIEHIINYGHEMRKTRSLTMRERANVSAPWIPGLHNGSTAI